MMKYEYTNDQLGADAPQIPNRKGYKMKHAKEPWARNGIDVILSVQSNRSVAKVYHPDDLERITACVNACKGISTESLENGAVKELLEALEWAHPYLVILGQAISDGIISPAAFARDNVGKIGALITKAKGEKNGSKNHF